MRKTLALLFIVTCLVCWSKISYAQSDDESCVEPDTSSAVTNAESEINDMEESMDAQSTANEHVDEIMDSD